MKANRKLLTHEIEKFDSALLLTFEIPVNPSGFASLWFFRVRFSNFYFRRCGDGALGIS